RMVHLAPTPPIPSPKMPPGMARLRRHHHMITAGHSPNYSCRIRGKEPFESRRRTWEVEGRVKARRAAGMMSGCDLRAHLPDIEQSLSTLAKVDAALAEVDMLPSTDTVQGLVFSTPVKY
ncbi:hypothetical protein, partial [Actinomadura latina]|uniref:hypothetical protein n=1 Tax=Actinomadura latina TaxID=163603 RepID=UPI001B34ADCB